MFKKRIKYTDFNGNEREEDFYFNLTKSELTEMEFSSSGGLQNYIQKIIDAQNGQEIISVMKDLIFKSYGEKSLDGKYFHKSKEISEAFSHTPAYDILFMELATDDKAASDFVNGIIPKNLELAQAPNNN